MPEMINKDGTAVADQAEALLGMLTSPDAFTSCFGRAMAADLASAEETFVDKELERGTPISIIMTVMVDVHVQAMASLAGQMLSRAGHEKIHQIIKDRMDQTFLAHAARCDDEIAALDADTE
jgi:hypothetical protein